MAALLAGTKSYRTGACCVDGMSVEPLVLTALILLIRPRWARALPRRFGAHVLSARSIRLIEREVVA